MNREIKFRFWYEEYFDEELFVMTYGDEYAWDEYEPIDSIFKAIQNSNGVVMQYTGFKDKNGKEIYEGDILQNSEYKDEVVSVEYFAGTWVASRPDEFTFPLSNIVGYFEVIGNIFEHPELLKNKES